MQLQYFLPALDLRPLLTIHAQVSGLVAPLADAVPAMTANLHIRLSGRSTYQFPGQPEVEAGEVTLIGASDASYTLRASEDCRMVIVGFLPLGWLKIIGEPASRLSRAIVCGSAIWRPSTLECLVDALRHTDMHGGHVPIVEHFVRSQMRADPPQRLINRVGVIDRWLERSPVARVDLLRAELGLTGRQLQRATADIYGASPKVLEIKYRALRTAAEFALNANARPSLAVGDYADQSHLIRDFRRFIGSTPRTFIQERSILAGATMRGRRAAGAARPLILLS